MLTSRRLGQARARLTRLAKADDAAARGRCRIQDDDLVDERGVRLDGEGAASRLGSGAEGIDLSRGKRPARGDGRSSRRSGRACSRRDHTADGSSSGRLRGGSRSGGGGGRGPQAVVPEEVAQRGVQRRELLGAQAARDDHAKGADDEGGLGLHRRARRRCRRRSAGGSLSGLALLRLLLLDCRLLLRKLRGGGSAEDGGEGAQTAPALARRRRHRLGPRAEAVAEHVRERFEGRDELVAEGCGVREARREERHLGDGGGVRERDRAGPEERAEVRRDGVALLRRQGRQAWGAIRVEGEEEGALLLRAEAHGRAVEHDCRAAGRARLLDREHLLREDAEDRCRDAVEVVEAEPRAGSGDALEDLRKEGGGQGKSDESRG